MVIFVFARISCLFIMMHNVMIKWRQLCFLIGYFLLYDFCPINLCHMLFVILVQSVLSEEMLLLPLSATLTAGWH